ncbi:esterase, partial [Sorangium cellulosum]
MRRFQNRGLVVASISLGLLAATSAHAASVVKVDRSTWGASGVPDYVNMHIYVPDRLAENPPIVVASHSCSTPVSGFFNSISGIRAGADQNGFIIILPEAAGRNCWDVGTTKSLTHDGGGDTQAIAQMVKYTLTKYGGNPERVYAMGGSSGAMMTQALLAVYPDIFRAGAARAGVPAGCWADGFDPSNQWSGSCAGGRTSKTAEAWGDQVRAMYPGYTGHRPRLQIFHGTADATINFNNHREAIKEWTNVLGLSATPTSTDTTTTANGTTYERQFWENECGQTVFEAWSGRDGAHSMPYEHDAILAFFGLDKAGAVDPETDCS